MSELKTLRKQKHPIALIENSIKRALQVPLNKLRKPQEKGRSEIIPFVSNHNPNNPNIFPVIRQTFENFQHSKTMSNVFNGKKLKKLYASSTSFRAFIMQVKIHACRRTFSR